MEIKVRALTDNKEILNRCRTTVWKNNLDKEPSEIFMENIYKAEHSPIRDKWFVIEIRGIKSWIATHFARHHVGYTCYISTQRDDRVNDNRNRDDKKQGELVNMDITLNAQAFINVSKKRLCNQAHIETQKIWNNVLLELKKIDVCLFENCVPECVYRGFCPEMQNCNRINSQYYKDWRKKYIGSRKKL